MNQRVAALCSLVLSQFGSANAGGGGSPEDSGLLDRAFNQRYYPELVPALPHAAPPKAGSGWLGTAGTVADSPLCREWKCRLLGTPKGMGHNNGVDYETYGFAARSDLRVYEWHSADYDDQYPFAHNLKIEGLSLNFKTAQFAQVQRLMPDFLRLATGLPLRYDLEKNCANAEFKSDGLNFSALLDKYGVNCWYGADSYQVNVFLGAGWGWLREAGDTPLSVLVGQGAAYRAAQQRGTVRVFKSLPYDHPSAKLWNAYKFKLTGRYVSRGQIYPFEVERFQEPGGGVFDVSFIELMNGDILAQTLALRTSAQDQKLLSAFLSSVSGQVQAFALNKWCVSVPFALGDPRNLAQASARRFTPIAVTAAQPQPQTLNYQRYGDEVQVIVRPTGSDMFWPAAHPFLLPAPVYP